MNPVQTLASIAVFLILPTVARAQPPGFDPATIFDEVWERVDRDFYDPDFNGVDLQAAKIQFRPLAMAAKNSNEFTEVINQMLATLNASHTACFDSADPRRFQLLGIFDFLADDNQLELLEYEGIGIDTELIDSRVYVRSVYDGFPASTAGIVFGDEIVSVAGRDYHGPDAFKGHAGELVNVGIRRTGGEAIINVEVAVQKINGRTMFETALQSSARVIEHNGHSIGYVHVWCYAGIKYHELLKSLVLFGKLGQCDSLIVDLRDGWGGASLEYLNLFQAPVVTIETRSRDGSKNNFTGVWGKPVVLLVNRRSTSGKELFAYGFKKLKLGEIVGETTAGAVLAGQPVLLSNGDLLYLAVTDIHVDGHRLEGIGVTPTIPVERPIPYAAGADPQLEKAVEILGGD
jgi:carboxyl-terminal processing protease